MFVGVYARMEKVRATKVLVVLVALLSLISWVLYTDNQGLKVKLSDQQNQIETLENYIQFYSRIFDSNVSPPVSKVEAVQKALSSDGWNSTSLRGMEIHVYLIYVRFWMDNGSRQHGYEYLGNVTHPLSDYSPRVEYNMTDPWSTSRVLGIMEYRYVWEIVVHKSSPKRLIPPPGLYLVDANTRELFMYNGLGFETIS
jgi:hypothetical protein